LVIMPHRTFTIMALGAYKKYLSTNVGMVRGTWTETEKMRYDFPG
jgi:hypothetical protein